MHANSRKRPAAAALGTVLLVVLLAGCGGKSGSPRVANIGTTTNGATTTTAETPSGSGGNAGAATPSLGGASLRLVGGGKTIAQFASCMRTHGEPNFPDPDAQGNLTINPSSGIDPSSSRFQAAQRACSKYLPNGGQPPSPAQQAKMQQQALKFSACMRSHGVPTFPDPNFGNGGKIAIHIGPGSGIDPRSPVFQAAQKACASELPGKAGPGSGPKVGTAGGLGTTHTAGGT
jgi:hypothetical protein